MLETQRVTDLVLRVPVEQPMPSLIVVTPLVRPIELELQTPFEGWMNFTYDASLVRGTKVIVPLVICVQ